MNYTPQMPQNICQNCNGPLTYIPQYNQWFCYRCNLYTSPPQVQQPVLQAQPPTSQQQYVPTPEKMQPPPKQKSRVLPIIGVIVVVLILIMAVFAYSVLNQPPDEEDMITIQDVSKIRELDVLHDVPIHYKTEDELRKYLINSLEPEDLEELEDTRLVLDALFLLDYEENLTQILIDSYSSQVLGLYNSEQKEIWILEEKYSISAEVVLSHELTHALQDQHFNLTDFDDAPNGDEDLARDAVVEGDATLLLTLYYYDYLTEEERNEFDRENSEDDDSDGDTPYVVEQINRFPYFYGVEFVGKIYQAGGWDDVNDLYYDPPKSTEQVMHIEKYYQKESPVSVSFDKEMQNMTLIFDDTMGEFIIYIMLANYISETDAEDAAEGWGGDRYYYYKNDTDFLSVFKIAWDTQGEAVEFYSTYQDWMDALPTKYQGIINEDRLRIDINQKVTTIYYSSDSDIIDKID